MCAVVEQSLISQAFFTVHFTNALYSGSGSSSTSLENLDEDVSSAKESPKQDAYRRFRGVLGQGSIALERIVKFS